MNLTAVDALIQKGRIKQRELQLASLNDEIAVKEAEVKEISSKIKSIEAERLLRSEDIIGIDRRLKELLLVQDMITEPEYQQAHGILMSERERLEKERAGDAADLGEISMQLNILKHKLDVAVDLRQSLTDPNHRPRHECNRKPDAFLPVCRQELRDFYEEYKRTLENLKQEDDLKIIHASASILGGTMRKWQDNTKDLNFVEQKLIHNMFGILCEFTNDVRCGLIEALNRNKQEDWGAWTFRKRGILVQLLENKKRMAAAPVNGNGHKAAAVIEEEPEEEEDPGEAKLLVQLIEKGVIKKTAGKRLTIYGGNSTRISSQGIEKWIEDVFQVKVKWKQSSQDGGIDIGQVLQSIGSGGVDIILAMTGWLRTDKISSVKSHSAKHHVVYCECVSTGHHAICRAIARGFGITLEV